MAIDERCLGGEQPHHLIGARRIGCPAVMNDRGGRRHQGTRRESPCAQAQIRLFAVHEEDGIEAAKARPQLPLDEEEAARDDIHLAHMVAGPTAVGFAVEGFKACEKSCQACGPAEQIPGRHALPAGRRIEVAVGEQRAPAPDAGRRMGAGECHELVDGAIEHHRVGVEQEDVAAFRTTRGKGVGAGKSNVLVEPDEVGFDRVMGDHLRRTIGGGIVHTNDFVAQRIGLAQYRGQCGLGQRAGVVADNDNRDIDVTYWNDAGHGDATCKRTGTASAAHPHYPGDANPRLTMEAGL